MNPGFWEVVFRSLGGVMLRAALIASKLLLMLSAFSGVLMTLLVSLSAVMRYAVGKPFGFTEELVGLLFSSLVFLALPYVTASRQHIEITLIYDLLPQKTKYFLFVLGTVLASVYMLWFAYYAFEFAYFSFLIGSTSDLGNIALWPWMGLMVVSSAIVAFVLILLLFKKKLLA